MNPDDKHVRYSHNYPMSPQLPQVTTDFQRPRCFSATQDRAQVGVEYNTEQDDAFNF